MLGFAARVLGFLSAVGMALAGAAGPSRAALVPLDDPRFGSKSVVLDTDTGLEWLNVGFSVGLSGNQVFAQTRPGQRFAGFSIAGADQFYGLVQEVFQRNVCCNVPLDPATTLYF